MSRPMTPGEVLDAMLSGKTIVDSYGYRRWWQEGAMYCSRNSTETRLDVSLSIFVTRVQDGAYIVTAEQDEEFTW